MNYLDRETCQRLEMLGWHGKYVASTNPTPVIHPYDALKFLGAKYGIRGELIMPLANWPAAVQFGREEWYYGVTEAEAVAKLVKSVAAKEVKDGA